VHFGVSPGGWCRGHRAARGRLSSGDGSNRLPPALCPLLSDSFPFWNRAKVKQDTFIVLATGYLKVSQGDDENYHLHLSEPVEATQEDSWTVKCTLFVLDSWQKALNSVAGGITE